MKFLQDDNGNYSSMRLMVLFGQLLIVYNTWLITLLTFHEMNQPVVNYKGLTELYLAMIGNLLALMIGKVAQKYIEKNG